MSEPTNSLITTDGSYHFINPPKDGLAYTREEVMFHVGLWVAVKPLPDGRVLLVNERYQSPAWREKQNRAPGRNSTASDLAQECVYGDVLLVKPDGFYWMGGNQGMMFPTDGFYSVSCPEFTVGIEIESGLVTKAPPLFDGCVRKLPSVLEQSVMGLGLTGKGPQGLTVTLIEGPQSQNS